MCDMYHVFFFLDLRIVYYIVIFALKNKLKLLNSPNAHLIDSKCTRLYSLSHHTFSLEYALYLAISWLSAI